MTLDLVALKALDFLADMFNDEIDSVRIDAINSMMQIAPHVVYVTTPVVTMPLVAMPVVAAPVVTAPVVTAPVVMCTRGMPPLSVKQGRA